MTDIRRAALRRLRLAGPNTIHRTNQSFYERDEISPLLIAQLNGPHDRGAARAVDAALFIVPDHVTEIGNRRVVHIGRTDCD